MKTYRYPWYRVFAERCKVGIALNWFKTEICENGKEFSRCLAPDN
jgi:hypothetical protein